MSEITPEKPASKEEQIVAKTPMHEDAYIIIEREDPDNDKSALIATVDAQPYDYQVPPRVVAMSVAGEAVDGFWWLVCSAAAFHNIKVQRGRNVEEPS